MNLPTISIVNFSNLGDREVQRAIRAVNRQVVEDFIPVWGGGRLLEYHAPAFGPGTEDQLASDPVRGDSVIYIVEESTLSGALGYHSMNSSEVPFGFVFVLGQADWTITLSHEVLELIIDPMTNVLVPGPDPRAANTVLRYLRGVRCRGADRV